MSIDFGRDTRLGDTLSQWWQGLDVHEAPRRPSRKGTQATGEGKEATHVPGDRAGRATLRRAHTITAVVMTPAYQRVYQRLCAAGWPANEERDDRLAAAIGLLAHVEADDGRPVPEAMSRRRRSDKGGDAGRTDADDGSGAASTGIDDKRPPVSPLRFTRLLESPDLDSLFTGLRRVLPLLRQDGKVRVNVRALATDVVNWHDDDAVKKRWAYGYDWPDKPGG